ncbi:hypothetical protein VTN77DRAFT_5946 [Rasamsonia byssochlamydoides]|uniref:uncharacterized protein n=1 Tax=Rasamsonia byssochlamydoides TaxID=89139 RepID=UPI0037446655
MPRTRTKFIWPPSTMTTDTASRAAGSDVPPAQTSTPEPRAKRPRVASPSTSRGQAALTEEQTLLQDDRDRPRGDREEGAGSSQFQPAELNQLLSSYLNEPMSAQIERYQNWRRNGSVHDDYCFICRRPKSLVPCNTCRRAFHDECMPPGSTYDEHNQWYCPVCVRRNWHVAPPTVTPPTSPPLSAQQKSTQDVPEQKLVTAESTSSSTPAIDSGPGNQQALSILAEISRSMSRGVPSKSTPEAVTSAAPPPCQTAAAPSPRPPGRPVSTRRNDPTVSTSSTSQGISLLDSHARKSRFATLSTEVDSALWVLYRELENAMSLRQHVAELEAEIVKLRQDVSIRDNQIILSQRAAQAGRLPQADIDRLRMQAAKAEAATREVEALRAKNEALEKELKEARAEAAAMNETLNEWKGKLINLIGN